MSDFSTLVYILHYHSSSILADAEGAIRVSGVAVDSIAEQVGLEAGDQILQVNGTRFADIKQSEVDDLYPLLSLTKN